MRQRGERVLQRMADETGGQYIDAMGGASLSRRVWELVRYYQAGAVNAAFGYGLYAALLWGGAWQTALVGLLQLYAGFELVRMTQHHRITATVASGAIAAIELLMWSPSSQLLAEFNVDSSSASFFINSLLGPLGLALATVVLVNRKIAPMAHATVRR